MWFLASYFAVALIGKYRDTHERSRNFKEKYVVKLKKI